MSLLLSLGLPPDQPSAGDPAFQEEPPIHFFDDDEPSRPWVGIVTWPAGMYVDGTKTTIIGWEAVVGSGKVIRVMSFTRPRTWDGVYQVGHFGLVDDAHGSPAFCRDADGYLYCFFGAHNTGLQWVISDSPDDISAWTEQTPIAGNITYPKPVLVGSTIYLFYRNYSVSTRRGVYLRTGTPSGGAVTFGAESQIIDLGADSRTYHSEFLIDGTDTHFLSMRANAEDSSRKHVYYFIYETDTGAVRNVAGTTTVASGSLPVDLTSANANFRIVDNGANHGDVPSLAFDEDGNAHVLYADGTVGGDIDLKHIVWNGSAWSSATTVATIEDKETGVGLGIVDVFCLVPGRAGRIEAWYPDNSAVAFGSRGGDMMRRIRFSNGTWQDEELIVAADTRALGHPFAIRDGHKDLRVAFCEVAQSADDTSKDFMKRYMHGDKGFIIEPEDIVIEGEVFANVSLQVDYSDRGTGTDADFADVVLLLDNSTGA